MPGVIALGMPFKQHFVATLTEVYGAIRYLSAAVKKYGLFTPMKEILLTFPTKNMHYLQHGFSLFEEFHPLVMASTGAFVLGAMIGSTIQALANLYACSGEKIAFRPAAKSFIAKNLNDVAILPYVIDNPDVIGAMTRICFRA